MTSTHLPIIQIAMIQRKNHIANKLHTPYKLAQFAVNEVNSSSNTHLLNINSIQLSMIHRTNCQFSFKKKHNKKKSGLNRSIFKLLQQNTHLNKYEQNNINDMCNLINIGMSINNTQMRIYSHNVNFN